MEPFHSLAEGNLPPSSPRRILMVGLEWFSDNPGGGGRYMTDVATGLAERGHEVTVLVPRQDPAHPDREIIDGVHVERFPLAGPAPRLVQATRLAAALAASRGPFDVVHSHFALHGLGPLWHPALAGARRVCQFQGPWAEESAFEGQGRPIRAAKYALERLAYARCDRFIVLSEAFGRLLARDYGVDPSRIAVIPAAVDTDRFAPAADRQALRAALGFGPGPVLLAVRRLVHRMGLEVLIDAFARVHAVRPDARLLIGGTGPLKEALAAQIARLGLEGAVTLLGRISDAELASYYQAADLTVVPTVALEGFGLITVESLACGTPVVGTTEGGTAEILSPLDARLLVPPGRVEPLAERLITFLDGRERLPDPAACRRYVIDHYHWPLILDRVETELTGEPTPG